MVPLRKKRATVNTGVGADAAHPIWAATAHHVGRCASRAATEAGAALQGAAPALLLHTHHKKCLSQCTGASLMCRQSGESWKVLVPGQQQCPTARAGEARRGGERPWARTGSGPWRPRVPHGPSSCCAPPAPPAARAYAECSGGAVHLHGDLSLQAVCTDAAGVGRADASESQGAEQPLTREADKTCTCRPAFTISTAKCTQMCREQ